MHRFIRAVNRDEPESGLTSSELMNYNKIGS